VVGEGHPEAAQQKGALRLYPARRTRLDHCRMPVSFSQAHPPITRSCNGAVQMSPKPSVLLDCPTRQHADDEDRDGDAAAGGRRRAG
jgi:hypothetical protein